MWVTALIIIEWLLWSIMAASTLYILFFALCSLLPRRKHKHPCDNSRQNTFLVLFPAYKEDAVIVHSVETFLKQDYPESLYCVKVISDRMKPSTDQALSLHPVTILKPTFEKSSKAKALQYAISETEQELTDKAALTYDYVVILDADNVVGPDFLPLLNTECNHGYRAIQCHRTAKNADNDIAVLDGVSEEINNSIFRKGHNRIGMSSALIGSGMCFDYRWFRANVGHLDSAVEDRELEALLMKQNVYIRYAEDIYVMDEKVSNSDNFQRQRLRWMTGQVQALLRMMPYIPKALAKGNFNYIDKTMQQALLPRSILLFCLFTFSIAITFISTSHSTKWWCCLAATCCALLIATPHQLRKKNAFSRIASLPKLVWSMTSNIVRIKRKNTEFIHTSHGNQKS